jgi:hypothetical protein
MFHEFTATGMRPASEFMALTPSQLLAMGHKKDPRVPTYSGADIATLMERKAEERKAWERS